MNSTIKLKKIENLVFQGGSVKGCAYVGALGALRKCFMEARINFDTQVKNVGGTSAGAITALLVSLNCTLDEIIKYLVDTDIKSFLHSPEARTNPDHVLKFEDQNFMKQSQTFAGALRDIAEKFGLFSGFKVLEWLENIIESKTGVKHCTFQELQVLIDSRKTKFKSLHIVGFNLTTNSTVIFNYETTPNSIISDAIRISMSIPIVFLPHYNYIKVPVDGNNGGNKKNGPASSLSSDNNYARVQANDDLWVDGGLTNNYPIRIFDKQEYNEKTLGFYFVSPEDKEFFEGHTSTIKSSKSLLRREIKTAFDYGKALLESVIDSQQMALHLHSRDPQRTIYISHLNVSPLDFGLTVENKQKLIESGWEAVCLRVKNVIVPCEINILKVKEEKGGAGPSGENAESPLSPIVQGIAQIVGQSSGLPLPLSPIADEASCLNSIPTSPTGSIGSSSESESLVKCIVM